ncbi:golgin-45-like isoform X1 [Vespa mandarinia]|uniref:golgin-45-like isoform X1 n=2 Tax=Vespa mandarinia TaxID=7446 RepID=UPI00161D1B9A|nr:golgin-45-like isoform X1 [Vespa mandarinia]
MAGVAENRKSKCQLQSEDVQVMDCIGRTQGDGMENVVMNENEAKQSKCRLNDSLIYYPKNLKQSISTGPVIPTGTIVNLIPKNITATKGKRQILNSLKTKEPKFVPYEPYKAAVNPIVPTEKKNKKHSKWDTNINVAVTDVAKLKINDTNVEKERNNEKDKKEESNWDKEKKIYESEIQKLKEENSQLENQLKFQAQVNGELKNLLVAAVGEDLETKVHLLTEDKLQLARALLNSAQHLSTHQEQTEWLAGQCEVWRSKFLASSLMVEELARWKAALCQRTTDLQESIKRLLEERKSIRDASLKTYRTLSILLESFDPVRAASYKRHALPSTNVIDLAQGSCQLAEILKVQLLSGMLNTMSNKDINITGLEMQTLAEKNAEQLLMSPNLLMSGRQDAACSAVMGAAFAIGGQIFIPRDTSNISCCPNCSGEVKQI